MVFWIWNILWSDYFQLQWGSEYFSSLVFKWSKRGWTPNALVSKCHLKTEQPQPFEYQTNEHHLIFLCTGLVFKWFWYIQYGMLTDHLKSEHQKVWYSYVSGGIQMVDIQIPTVQDLFRILTVVDFGIYLIGWIPDNVPKFFSSVATRCSLNQMLHNLIRQRLKKNVNKDG